MNDEELEQAIHEIIKTGEFNTCAVMTNGKVFLDGGFTCQEIVAIAELLKKEGRV